MTKTYYYVTYRAWGADGTCRNYYSADERDKAKLFAACTEWNNGVCKHVAKTPRDIAACEERVAYRRAQEDIEYKQRKLQRELELEIDDD